MKQTSVEWLYKNLLENPISNQDREYNESVFHKAKEMEKQQQGYIEKEVLAFGKDCFYKGFEKAQKDDANCYTAFIEEIGILVKQFKKK